MTPAAYDCVRLIVVRDGTAVLFSEFGERPIRPGDVVLLGANVLCGCEPEGHLTITTIYLDTDYVVDLIFWQYIGVLNDRLAAQGFAETVYAEPAQILRLGEHRSGMMMPWLDELVALSLDGAYERRFHRMQALWFAVADVITPYVRVSPVRISESQRARTRPTVPRDRRFGPLREDARHAAERLRSAPEHEWTLQALANEAHLSASQFGRVFADAYGKTPMAYLTMIRAERLATLLRETDMTVKSAMREVGWHSRGHAARLFRQCVGLTPTQYRSRVRTQQAPVSR